ncbi:MAG: 23S rRNA (adenine(2030)-N(6))-methyltransferase RlmJ [Pseudomonadota bacterium]|nr:23S rRNA (adenine(2030)-N(6))-methyltransferase RlmJ [Pseudomonadota bacterium]
MLSYRHGYHAGNHADVLKHAVLAFCLDYMMQKPKPVFVIDTHAGAGRYDLGHAFATKTAEWQDGIGRVFGAPGTPELLRRYLDIVEAQNADGALHWYPGSPSIIGSILRPEDRVRLVELHPSDHDDLDRAFRRRAVKGDGFRELVAAMPPRERRGLALIDPSYEIKDDYARVAEAVRAAHRRFATGTFVVWYPVVDRARTETMLDELAESGIRGQYRIEIAIAPDSPGHGMTAAGVLVINPPWPLPQAAEAALPWLAERLAARGPLRATWSVPE